MASENVRSDIRFVVPHGPPRHKARRANRPRASSHKRMLFIFGSAIGAGLRATRRSLHRPHGHHLDPRRGAQHPRAGPRRPSGGHAEDHHRVVEAVGFRSVDAFGSSSGGMCGLQWSQREPSSCQDQVMTTDPSPALFPSVTVAFTPGGTRSPPPAPPPPAPQNDESPWGAQVPGRP
jgi:hypothetical protein